MARNKFRVEVWMRTSRLQPVYSFEAEAKQGYEAYTECEPKPYSACSHSASASNRNGLGRLDHLFLCF